MDGQGTKESRKTAENFNRLGRVHERDRQTTERQTDGRATAYSERGREFTFAKNSWRNVNVSMSIAIFSVAQVSKFIKIVAEEC